MRRASTLDTTMQRLGFCERGAMQWSQIEAAFAFLTLPLPFFGREEA